MSALSVALRIWIKTVLLNALLLGLVFTVRFGFTGVLVFLIALIGGVILTSPVLLLIVPLLRLYQYLSYDFWPKTVWLCGMLFIPVILFYKVIDSMTGEKIFSGGDFITWGIHIVTCLAVTLSVLDTRRSLRRLE